MTETQLKTPAPEILPSFGQIIDIKAKVHRSAPLNDANCKKSASQTPIKNVRTDIRRDGVAAMYLPASRE